MRPLSARQIDYLWAIQSFKDRGIDPSYCDLMAVLDLRSSNAVYLVLDRLRAKGILAKEQKKARTTVLTKQGMDVLILNGYPLPGHEYVRTNGGLVLKQVWWNGRAENCRDAAIV